ALLCCIRGTLCIQYSQIVVNSGTETGFRQAVSGIGGFNQTALSRNSVTNILTYSKCIVHFTEGSLDRLFVISQCNLLIRFRNLDVCLTCAPVKDWNIQAWTNCPDKTARLEQITQISRCITC